jgi:hypothetical protein
MNLLIQLFFHIYSKNFLILKKNISNKKLTISSRIQKYFLWTLFYLFRKNYFIRFFIKVSKIHSIEIDPQSKFLKFVLFEMILWWVLFFLISISKSTFHMKFLLFFKPALATLEHIFLLIMFSFFLYLEYFNYWWNVFSWGTF